MNISVLLRKISASPLSLGQSKGTKLFCTLGSLPNHGLGNHEYPGVGITVKFGACQHTHTPGKHREETSMFPISGWSHQYFSCALSGRKFERCPLQLISHHTQIINTSFWISSLSMWGKRRLLGVVNVDLPRGNHA